MIRLGMSDFQVTQIYGAEKIITPVSPNLTTRQAQEYANRIMKTQTWKRLSSSRQGVSIRRLRANARSSQTEDNNLIINLAPAHHNRMSVTHEMAHILTGRLFGRRVMGHGLEYAWVLRCLLEDIRTDRDFLKWKEEALRLGVSWDRDAVERRSRFRNN